MIFLHGRGEKHEAKGKNLNKIFLKSIILVIILVHIHFYFSDTDLYLFILKETYASLFKEKCKCFYWKLQDYYDENKT